MEYRSISGIKVSQIGFGCWQLGGSLSISGIPLSYGQIDEKEASKAISLALDNGINFFDTADFYGLGRSEYFLGQELNSKRDKAVICTKVGGVADGLVGCVNDGSYEHIIAACNRSLKKLKTDYIDIYLLHFVPNENERESSIRAFHKLKKEGKIREYGVSLAHNLKRIGEFTDDFPVIEGYYNMIMRDFENYQNQLKGSFIAASPISRGLLSGKNYALSTFDDTDVRKKWAEGMSQHEWYNQQREKIAKVSKLAEEFAIPLKNLAITYVISNPKVSVTIPGMKNSIQVSEIIESMKHYPLSPEKICKIKLL
jgi:aryl-alcohol dehydrogenase-like predicted oxidoreductase